MTKTVKEIVDEYVNRQSNSKFNAIVFQYPEDGRLEQHSEIYNLYRDGILVTELDYDLEAHNYQLDRKFDSSITRAAPKWVRYTFRGRIVRFSEVIEE